mmetsp:Transcript_34188/g.46243  ORF Transcript_34188/g.46243 Transcript_34188/m.46243 type:complete len:216 (-) Transcript_34188:210-857(-)
MYGTSQAGNRWTMVLPRSSFALDSWPRLRRFAAAALASAAAALASAAATPVSASAAFFCAAVISTRRGPVLDACRSLRSNIPSIPEFDRRWSCISRSSSRRHLPSPPSITFLTWYVPSTYDTIRPTYELALSPRTPGDVSAFTKTTAPSLNCRGKAVAGLSAFSWVIGVTLSSGAARRDELGRPFLFCGCDASCDESPSGLLRSAFVTLMSAVHS